MSFTKNLNLITILTIFTFFLFFIPSLNAAYKSEGEDLIIQAINQTREGMIDKSIFITKDPPYMKARIAGETKAINIYIFSSALYIDDKLRNARLLDQTIDAVVMGLVQMLKFIEQGKNQIFMEGSVNTNIGSVYILITLSSSYFYPEDYDFVYQATDLIDKGLLDKDALIAEDGMTPLMWASLTNDAEIVNRLIGTGVNPNKARDSDGKTALLVASFNGYEGIVEILLKNGAIIDLADGEGRTALILASKKGYIKVVKILLERGAVLDLVDMYG